MKKYLALGDSYTIGELVDYQYNMPNQLNHLLNLGNEHYAPPNIIAKTGWTTDELANAIALQKPSFDYDLVTLLIGVNNQYRGREVAEYYWQFYSLLCQAILFAKSNVENVVVLSIPDWGLTPFNKDRNKEEVSAQIDDYNKVNKEISDYFGIKYIDVTASTRFHANDTQFLASDTLHYSEKEYALWAQMIYDSIK